MRNGGSAARLALGAILAVFAAGCALAAQNPFEFRHGVIVDRARSVIYTAGAKSSVEAIGIGTGRTVWTSTDAALPLAIRGTLIAAQAEDAKPGPRLRLVLLNAIDGKMIAARLVDLPPDVRALVSDQLGESFRATATYDAGGFAVTWTYRKQVIQGVRPDAGEPPALKLSGTTRIDVPPRWASRAREARSPNDCRAKTVSLPQTPWRAGRVLAIAAGERGEALTLKRWNACSGKALPDRVLSPKALVVLASADERHVLVGERVGSGGPDDPEYRWSIFSLETAKKIGERRSDVSSARFFIHDDAIVFESQPHGFRQGNAWIDVPLELIAVRLTSNEPKWHRPIRDLEYRGPTPPTP